MIILNHFNIVSYFKSTALIMQMTTSNVSTHACNPMPTAELWYWFISENICFSRKNDL